MKDLFQIERIMGFCEKVCYFFMVNLLFLCSNVCVLLFLLFVGIGQLRNCLPLFLLCMVFMAPALTGVLYSMNRLIQGTETGAWADYTKGYRQDFFQKICLGAGQMMVIFLVWTNMEFFSLQLKSTIPTVFFGVLLAVVILVTPYLYMLVVRYNMKNMEIVRTAITLFFARPVETVGSIAAIGLVLMIFELTPGTTVLFMGSVYGFLIMFMNQRVMRKLESQ